MAPTSTSGQSVQGPPFTSSKLLTQLLECLVIPATVVIILAIIICVTWRHVQKRRRQQQEDKGIISPTLPVLMVVPPSRDTDIDAVESAWVSSARMNSRIYTSGLTVPPPAKKSKRDRRPLPVPETPVIRPLDAGDVSLPVLDLGPPLLSPILVSHTPIIQPLDGDNVPIIDLGPPLLSR